MMRIRYSFLCFVAVLWTAPVAGQETGSPSTAVVIVETNSANSLVFADSTYLGKASNAAFEVPATVKQIRLVPPTLNSWSVPSKVKELNLAPGDTLNVAIHFSYRYNIESIPYEAQVFLEKPEERILLGTTPVLHASKDPLRGMLLVAKSGYDPVRLPPGEDIWNAHRVELTRRSDNEIAEKFWHPEERSDRWIDYVAGGVAVVSGIMAIRFKTKANRRYDRYVESGDPTLRGGFERYDRYFAVSLGTMQVGVGVLAVRFVLD